MLQRVSKGDVLLPRELNAERAMAAPWIFNAINQAMQNIDENGVTIEKDRIGKVK